MATEPMPKPASRTSARNLPLATLADLMIKAHGSEHLERAIQLLLALSPSCRRGHAALRRLSRELRHPDYAIVLAEARDAPLLSRRLAALSYPGQLVAVEADESLQTWGLCRLLQ